MKTKINQWVAAGLFGLITLGGNVSAKGTEVTASSRENITEPALQLENWITDEKIWDIKTTGSLIISEDELQLEEWMLNEQNWLGNGLKNSQTEKDSPIMLESWMLKEQNWFR